MAALGPKPAAPKAGGHYVNVGGKWQPIHAVGPNKWAPGLPPAAKPPAKATGPNYSSPLYDPSQTLTGKPLSDAAQAIANAQTQPAINQYKSQITANNQANAGDQRTDFGYYMQLAKAAQGAVAQSGQTGTALQGQLQGIASNTQNQLQQLGQSYQGGALGRLNAQGLGGDSSANLQAQTQQGQGFAAQNAANAQTFGAMQSANNMAQAGQLAGSVPLAGTEQIGALSRGNTIANNALQAQITGKQGENATDYATALGQLRTSERNYSIAQQGLANTQLNTSSEIASRKAATANNAAKTKIAGQQAKTAAQRAADASGQNAFNDNPLAVGSPAWARSQTQQGTAWSSDPNAVGSPAWSRVQQANAKRAAAAGKGSGAKPLPRVANNTWLKGLGTLQTLVADGKAHGNTNAQIKTFLTNGKNPTKKTYDPVQVQAALELYIYHYISPQTAQNMHALGVRGGTYNNLPIQIGAGHAQNPNPLLPPGTGTVLRPGSLGF